jgi:pantoate--beta-alanine ligase
MALVISTPQEFKLWRRNQNINHTIGFVPTMGALHSGHEELLKTARRENDLLILSIYVNPTQFNDPNDFDKYPQTWSDDLKLADLNKVDVVFAPKYTDMYSDGYRYKVVENRDSLILDGTHRPGHFDGVLTVVMKLFNIVSPTRAYFGEKDFQQLHLIRGMAENFFMDLKIIPVATVREADGLAKSSRNIRLSGDERKKAPLIYKIITTCKTAEEAKEQLVEAGFKVDYVTDIENRRFVAAFLGDVRLIDNVEI